MRAGAHGYLLKGANHTKVRHAVHVVAAGGAKFGPAIAQRVIEFFSRPRPAGVTLPFPQLTDREHEILDLLAQGQPNGAIATHLHISPKTVRNHVSNIFTKLAVADRAQASYGRGRPDLASANRTQIPTSATARAAPWKAASAQ